MSTLRYCECITLLTFDGKRVVQLGLYMYVWKNLCHLQYITFSSVCAPYPTRILDLIHFFILLDPSVLNVVFPVNIKKLSQTPMHVQGTKKPVELLAMLLHAIRDRRTHSF